MNLDIYSGICYKAYVKNGIRKQYMRKTSVEKYSNGIIVNEHSHGFGVFDKDFKFVKSSRQTRKNNGQFVPKFNHNNIPYIDEDVVFIGNVYPQFGHFLLEHMNRAYALLDKKYKNMKVVLINNQDANPVPNYMFRLLELLGVKHSDIIILNETTRFRNVYIPVQGYNIPIYSSEGFGKTFDAIANAIPKPKKTYDKIYMSRDALKSRRTYDEKIIQDIFEKNGFHIVYPETLSLEEQISLAHNCNVLAGCAGTALHWALVMKPGGTVIQIKRNRKNDDNSASQYLINETKKLNSIFVAASVEKYKTGHGYDMPQVVGLNKYMREFFDKNNFKYDKNLPVVLPDLWNEYIDACRDVKLGRGGMFMFEFKNKLVHYSACFIPGRERRGRWRNWLKRKLHC